MDESLVLTTRQREVYDFIAKKTSELGYPPTVREIGEGVGISSTNGVIEHIRKLSRKGYLEQRAHKSRAIVLKWPESVPRDESSIVGRSGAEADAGAVLPMVMPVAADTISIPLLGRVAAGEPILAEERAEGHIVVDSMLVGGGDKRRRLFALKVVGSSMIEDGIFDGDYIFVRKREEARDGEIVVVMIEDEATVKRYYLEGDRVRLQPGNSAMAPIYISRDDFRQVQVIGVVAGVYRRMADS